MEESYFLNPRLSMKQKNANSKAWYKYRADRLVENHSTLYFTNTSDVPEFLRMKVNYDLCNNVLNTEELDYVCKPFGSDVGELPAKMMNRDIISGKIKSLVGMEMKRAFSWNVIATNAEATTRREKMEFDLIKKSVVSEIMIPIEKEIRANKEAQNKGKELSPDELEKIEQEVQAELKQMTPQEVLKYMKREYQDPAEVLGQQLLEYLIQKEELPRKFNEIFEHGCKSARELLYVGIVRGEPVARVVNPLRFNYEKSPDNQFIEESDWCTYEYRMSPTDVVKYFGDELSNSEIDSIFEEYQQAATNSVLFDFSSGYEDVVEGYVRVVHCCFKALREVKFLTYLNQETNVLDTILVSEDYKINPEFGDISLESEWIPEVYEVWKIGKDLYKRMQPVPGQFKDLDNLYNCKLPYYGAVWDNMNSQETCPVDRLKHFQYLYNIAFFRLEELMASDGGKKLLMNINAVPDSLGIDIKKWQYYMKATPVIWYNPTEEGSEAMRDAGSIAKEIDMSLTSDITKYIEICEYIRRQAGVSVGITDLTEGAIGPNEAVTNVRQSLIQTSHILEPYFNLHNIVKKNILQALLDTAKVAYTTGEKRKLTYVLDDLSRATLNVEPGLLDNNTLGIFVDDSSRAEEAKEAIRQLAHAAMQNQKAELSDVLAVLRQKGIVEAEETLKVAEQNRREFEQQSQNQQLQLQSEEAEKAREFEREKHNMKLEQIVVQEEEKRKTEIVKGSIMAASYNPDVDKDNDGINDFLELSRNQLDVEVAKSKVSLERDKFEYQKDIDKKKLELEKEKLSKKNVK